jgi:hypothetical protein
MPAVTNPISRMLAARGRRRPRRSPQLANSRAPAGRARKATPNTAKVASSRADGSSPGKKVVAMTLANAP